MSQTPAEGQGQQSGVPALPAGVQPGSAAASAVEPPTQQGQQSDDQGKGGKEAVLADLAKERQQRHALEQQLQAQAKAFDDFKASLGNALGVNPQQVTPEQLAAQNAQAQATQQEAMTQLAVFQLAPTAGADPTKLLDSRSFLNSIKDIPPTDTAALQKAIKTAVDNNKTLGLVRPGAGSTDAGTTAGTNGQKPSISELLRAASGR